MSDVVLVALVTTLGSGVLVTVLNHFFNRKTKVVERNTLEVEAATKAIGGMETLLDNYRGEIKRSQEKIEKLEKDLIEEKSLNVILNKELEKCKGS